MDTTLLDEVIACLPRERTLFDYFQGHYALDILAELAEREAQQPVQFALAKASRKAGACALRDLGAGARVSSQFRT